MILEERRNAVLAWLLIVLGIALRLRTYIGCRALRRDEAMLTLNLVRRTYSGLLRPLDDDQGAPIGFLMLEKLSIHALGHHEYALRLVPLLAALASLPLFWLVAKRLVGAPGALIGLGLFAMAEPLVFYASETKQYSVDLAIALGLLAIATVDRKRPLLLALAGAGAASVWFSHASLFVLGGIGLAALLFDGRPRATLSVAACWAASFVVEDRLILRDLRNNDFLRRFWSASFMPFPPRSADDARWFLSTFFDTFKDPVGLPFTGLAAALFLVGVVSLARDARRALTLVLTPVALALIASGLKAYPFSTRLILFSAPLFLIPIAAGVVSLGHGPDPDRRRSAGVLLLVLALYPAIASARNLVRPLQAEELKAVMQTIARRLRPGDEIYLYFASEPAYRFYSEYADRPLLTGISPVVGHNGRADRSVYAGDVERLRGHGRVWFVFSHAVKDDESFFLDHLDATGRRLDGLGVFGASAYLYDLQDQ
jgi:hypothetical protein